MPAQQTVGDDVAGEDSVKAKQVLVLKSGRVVKGNIRPRGTGYDIDQKNGHMFVGSEQVWLLADDLPQAYQTIKDSFAVLTPDIHMQIASWCSDHQLWGTARRELLDALHLDPYREDARRMLARILRLQDQAHQLSAGPQQQKKDVGLHVTRLRRSLGGLSIELAGEFTRRIQPLLSNKCAGCHRKDSERTFVMESVRTGSTPQIASQNLDAILEQLDSPVSKSDSFLEMALSRHGSMETEPFNGQVGTIQRDRLKAWIDSVRRQRGLANIRPTAATSGTVRNVDSDAAPADVGTPQQSDSSLKVATSIELDTHPVGKTAEDGLLDDARRRNRIDKFDPEIFNQRYRVSAQLPDSETEPATRGSL